MPRPRRRRWAAFLALEFFVVAAVSGYALARFTGDRLAWIAPIGGFAWFAFFLILLARAPRSATKWALLGLPIMLLVTSATYVILRSQQG